MALLPEVHVNFDQPSFEQAYQRLLQIFLPAIPGLTLVGGLLFAYRYTKTGSLLTSCVEHALYGCFLFTVGLGRFFYHAA